MNGIFKEIAADGTEISRIDERAASGTGCIGIGIGIVAALEVIRYVSCQGILTAGKRGRSCVVVLVITRSIRILNVDSPVTIGCGGLPLDDGV